MTLVRVYQFLYPAHTNVSAAKWMLGPLVLEDPFMFTICIVATVLHILCHVSIDHCTFLLHGIRVLLQLCLLPDGRPISSTPVPDIPDDVRVLVRQLDLRPTTRGYCCCPKCFCCYSLDDYPSHCTNMSSPDAKKPCGRSLRQNLLRGGVIRTYAARRYLYHDMRAWMGEMLCRPGMEEHLDRNVFETGALEGELRDVWDGRILKNFCGPDGKLFVGTKPNDEGRYVFALNMDGFNPFGKKQAGKSVSCGAIYMVCLNLPPHLRYRIENMFLVSVIPGPNHPSLTETNELLRPLVDDLLKFWNPGVFFSRTWKYDKGRLVRCALVPLICDLPAARQIMAFASHSAKKFCCYCGVVKADIDNLDMKSWPPGVSSREEWVRIAEEWKAGSVEERTKLFEEHGIRYSELLRLPYWDPTSFVVVDSMHAMFLTDLRHHCRELWGMDVTVADGDGRKFERGKRAGPSPEKVNAAWDVVHYGRDSDIEKLGIGILRELCAQKQLGVRAGAQKGAFSKALRDFVRRFLASLSIILAYSRQRRVKGWANERGEPMEVQPRKPRNVGALTAEELQEAERVWASTASIHVLAKLRRPALVSLFDRSVSSLNSSMQSMSREDAIFASSFTSMNTDNMNKDSLAEQLLLLVGDISSNQ